MSDSGTYSLSSYGGMIRDRIRLDAFLNVLRANVSRDTTVLDLGTGTGFFAITAAMLGAKKVYAIEPSDAIVAAREVAQANGVADRVEFIQGDSREVELPEKVDVMISDLRGVTPFYGKHFEIVADARDRFLADGGVQIGLRDEMYVAACDAPKTHQHLTESFEKFEQVDFSPLRPYIVNTWVRDSHAGASLLAENLVTDSELWATIDYTTNCNPNKRGSVKLECRRDGTIHGLVVWFRAILAEDVMFDTAPKTKEQVYGRMFYPLPEPQCVANGDMVEVMLQANLVNEEYIWRWRTRIPGKNAQPTFAADQSSLLSVPLSREMLSRRALDFAPKLSSKGESSTFVLQQMNGEKSLSDIANDLMQQYPQEFPTPAKATSFVGSLSSKYAA